MDKRIWISVISFLGLLDWWCAHVKHKGTLSQAGREVFKTNTVPGKVIWTASWLSLTAWILPHIWNWPETLEEMLDNLS